MFLNPGCAGEQAIAIGEAVTRYLYATNKHIHSTTEFDPGTVQADFRTGLGQTAAAYSYGAQVARVAVDPDTGRVTVLRVVSMEDCGRAINPMALEGQAEGSIVCGLGMALMEDRLVDRGITLNPSFLEYKVPTILESPEILSEAVESIDPKGPFGAKGVSEGYQVPTAPAIANAVYNAIGVRFKNLPITPDQVWKALQERSRGRGEQG